MRLLVCGCRNWSNYDLIWDTLLCYLLTQEDMVITGGAPGADTLAHQAAVSLGAKTEVYPADWCKYGKAAGPIRNQQMLDEGRPDEVLAFWDGKSRGTKDMIERAGKAGLPVLTIHGEPEDLTKVV